MRNLVFLLVLFATRVRSFAIQQQTFDDRAEVQWKQLGPFPIGTRELPLLPFLDGVNQRSPLVVGGVAEWRNVSEDGEGWVEVEDKDIE